MRITRRMGGKQSPISSSAFGLFVNSVVYELSAEFKNDALKECVHLGKMAGEKMIDSVFSADVLSLWDINGGDVGLSKKECIARFVELFFTRIVPAYLKYSPKIVRFEGSTMEVDFSDFYVLGNSPGYLGGVLSVIGAMLSGMVHRMYSTELKVVEVEEEKRLVVSCS